MRIKIEILILVFVTSTLVFGAGTTRRALLTDGFALKGLDGRVSCPDDKDMWSFELESDVNDDGNIVKAGTDLQLLFSSTLEKVAEDLKVRSGADYRLWGRATKYKDENFIFPFYFLPLSKIKQSQSDSLQTTSEPKSLAEKQEAQPIINEPNDVLAIPLEVIEKLRTRRIDPARWPGRGTEPIIQPPQIETVEHKVQQDFILADRTAILERQNDGQFVFVLDALGQNVSEGSLRLLPCEALELAENMPSTELEPMRFKIAGIITEYKGNKFLLLQKITQVYSYGNFGR